MSTGPISFQNDIMPLFNRFQAPMAWRFDLTNYETVKANAQLILGRIQGNGGPMPPPPLAPLTDDQINMFQQWITDGCQP